jgi:hypothetical protein
MALEESEPEPSHRLGNPGTAPSRGGQPLLRPGTAHPASLEFLIQLESPNQVLTEIYLCKRERPYCVKDRKVLSRPCGERAAKWEGG